MYESNDQPAGKFCSKCGNSLRVDAKFCPHCGTAVTLPTPLPSPPYQPPVYNPPPSAGVSDPTQAFPPGQQVYQNPPQIPYMPPPQSPYPSQPAYQPIPFSNNLSRVNLSLALQYPFASSNWLSIMLIGGFLILIPLLGLIVVNGYMVEIIRRVANDDYDVLPGWDDFGTKLKDGLFIWVLLIIWAFLPVLLLSVPGYLLLALGEDIGITMAAIGAFLGMFVTYFFLPIVWGRFAVTNQFAAGLQVGQIWKQVQVNIGRYVGNWLLTGLMLFVGITVISIFASIAGALMVFLVGLCVVPFVLMASFYTVLIQAHLMGQLYRVIM